MRRGRKRMMNPSTLATVAATVVGVAAGAAAVHYLHKTGRIGGMPLLQGAPYYPGTTTIRRVRYR